MKTNPNDSINSYHGDTYQSADGYITSNFFNAGLTKREWFAGMALAGLCPMCIPGSHNTTKQMVRELPEKAVALADALIEELNK